MRICELKQKEVINIHTIKPLDEDLVIASAQKTGKVVTVKPDVLPPLWFPDLAVSAFVSGEPEVNI